MKHKLLVFIIVVALVLGLFPISSFAYSYSGLDYDDYEYGQLLTFLESPSAVGGEKNGERINPGSYDPADPETWGVQWSFAPMKKVIGIGMGGEWYDKSLNGILDLTGFNELTTVSISINSIDGLILDGAVSLSTLECFDNDLTALNVDTCGALTYLLCDYNQLSTLSLINNPLLEYLYCSDNLLSALDLSNNTALVDVACYRNQLETLTLPNTTTLKEITCNENLLESLDVSNNTELTVLRCSSNKLTSLNVGANTELLELRCTDNLIEILNVDANTKLTALSCGSNEIDILNVINNTSLVSLSCGQNNISSLNIAANTLLTTLGCDMNQLESLSLTTNTLLTRLSCSRNQLISLNLITNTLLEYLYCPLNQLTTLNLSANDQLSMVYMNGNMLTHIEADLAGAGGVIVLDAVGNGYVALDADLIYENRILAVAEPMNLYYLENWTASSIPVSTDMEYDLTIGQNYDLDANFALVLALDASPFDGGIYVGGRIDIIPNIEGGTWDFDANFLSGDFSGEGGRFTGLQNGTVRVTYTAGDQSKYIDVEIDDANLPSTGQDYTWVFVLAALALGVLAAGLLIRKRSRAK